MIVSHGIIQSDFTAEDYKLLVSMRQKGRLQISCADCVFHCPRTGHICFHQFLFHTLLAACDSLIAILPYFGIGDVIQVGDQEGECELLVILPTLFYQSHLDIYGFKPD